MLSLNIAADTKTKDTNASLTQKIEAIDYDLLELETQLDMGIEVSEVLESYASSRYFDYRKGRRVFIYNKIFLIKEKLYQSDPGTWAESYLESIRSVTHYGDVYFNKDEIIAFKEKAIKSQLLHFEYQLGTPRGDDDQWNESEQMILDAKVKLEALQEKMKVEGDWGKVRFRVQDFGGSDPGAVKLRYNYGF